MRFYFLFRIRNKPGSYTGKQAAVKAKEQAKGRTWISRQTQSQWSKLRVKARNGDKTRQRQARLSNRKSNNIRGGNSGTHGEAEDHPATS